MQRKNSRDIHPFQEIQQLIQEDKIPSVLLLSGREDFLIRWVYDAIVTSYVNPVCIELDRTRIDADATTVDEVIGYCETLPMLSRKRIVFVEDLKAMEGTKMKNMDEESIERLGEYFLEIPDSCILLITCKKPDKRRKLYLALKSAGIAYDMTALPRELLEPFILKRFRTVGKTIPARLLSQLINESGYLDKDSDYTLYQLENDLKKIIAHSEETEIKPEDIRENLSRNLDDNIFQMLESMQSDQKGNAYLMLHNLLTARTNEMMILATICSQFELILMIREMRDAGHSTGEIKSLLGVHDYRFEKILPFAGKLSPGRLRTFLSAAYEADRNIKNGVLEAGFALELLILTA